MKFSDYMKKNEIEDRIYEMKVKSIPVNVKETSKNKKLSINEIVKLAPNYSEYIKYSRKYGKDYVMHGKFPMYSLSTPKIHTKPKNTYHEMIMNNSLNWKKYPDINKSMIMRTTSLIKAKTTDNYGVYVFPNNNSKIALGTRDSFEDCFSRIDKNFEKFDNDLSYILYLPEKRQKVYKNINDLKKACDDFDIWARSENTVFPKRLKNIKWISKWGLNGSFFDYVQFVLDPTPNGFTLVDYKKLITINKIAWMENDAISIRYDKITTFLNKL